MSTIAPTSPTTPSAPRLATSREWIGLSVLALACMVVVMDVTVLHLSIPKLTIDLHPTPAQMLWIVDVYGFLVAGCLVTMGSLGDRIGRKRLLLVGAGAFMAASVFAAFSTSAQMLILARALLGIAGATVVPSTLSLIRNMFHDPGQLGRAISLWSASFALGALLGPLIGGLLLEHFWWGSVFLINVPIMVALLALAPWTLPESRDATSAGRIDLLSVALSLVAVLAVVFGLKRLAQDGFDAAAVLGLALGLAVGWAFVRRQLRLKDPLLDVSLFRSAQFTTSLVVGLIGAAAMFAVSFLGAQYYQLVLGLSPQAAGLWTMPGAIAVLLGFTLAPNLAKRFDPVHVIAVGFAIVALGLLLFTQVGAHPSLWLVVTTSIVMSLGIGPPFTLMTGLIMGSVPPERAGAASGVMQTSNEMGGALGIAVFGSVGVAAYRAAVVVPEGVPVEAAEAARSTLGGAVASAGGLPGPTGDALLAAAQAAYAESMAIVAFACFVLVAASALAVFLVLGRKKIAGAAQPVPKAVDGGA